MPSIAFTCIVYDAFYLHRGGGVIYLQCSHCYGSYVFIILCFVLSLHCTVIEIRSLVQARDDGIVGACDVLWVFGSVGEDVRARGVCSGRSGKNF